MAVVTQPPVTIDPSKSATSKVTISPVHIVALKLGIPLFIPESAKDVQFLDALEALSPDLCVTAAYGNYLPKRFLAIPKFGTLNIHPSLLPKYRGAAPVQRCLENGDAETGVTVLFTATKMDAGPIVRQSVTRLLGHEKSTEVLSNLFELGTEQLIDSLPSVFDGTAVHQAREQDEAQASSAPKISSAEARVDFSQSSAVVIHNKVRAFAGWPGVWTTFCPSSSSSSSTSSSSSSVNKTGTVVIDENNLNGSSDVVKIVKLISTMVLDPKNSENADMNQVKNQDMNLHHSRSVKLLKKQKQQQQQQEMLRVVCADGSVLGVLEVQPVSGGKKAMDARAFLNGMRGVAVEWCVPPLALTPPSSSSSSSSTSSSSSSSSSPSSSSSSSSFSSLSSSKKTDAI